MSNRSDPADGTGTSAHTWDARNVPQGRTLGLPECMDFFERAEASLPLFSDGGWCAVSIDFVHFKLLAEWFGLDRADDLLWSASETVRSLAERTGGIAGYLGQDSFCALIPDDGELLEGLHRDLTEDLGRITSLDGFSVSIGVAPIDGSSSSVAEYLNHAALAVEKNASDGRRAVRRYDADMFGVYSEEYRTLCEFERALSNGEITFWLQPQYRVSNRKIVGAESLARWIKPDGTTVSSAFFVPVLEKYDAIIKLDLFIWESVLKWMGERAAAGRPLVPVALNVSRVDLFSLDVPTHIFSLVKKYSLTVHDIKVEITESACEEDSGLLDREVKRLRDLGFTVLMDDFGSGYSSLNMLRRLSLDVIKLDAQFLKLGANEQRGINILESVVNMTKNLGTPLIAEGVETREQVRFLSDLGCEYMQGYYFSAPMPVAEFERLIGEEGKLDDRGFVFKGNRQFRFGEFLDGNVFSDAMINNVIGPVAIYRRVGGSVDIIRYNQQFFELVGITPDEMAERQHGIEKYLVADDVDKLRSMLDYAKDHPALCSKGAIRAIRPNGAIVSFGLKLYYVGDDTVGEKYYCSARDETELQLINFDQPGAYVRYENDSELTLLYVSDNFKKMTGFDADDINEQFDGKLLRMVHPAEKARLSGLAALPGESGSARPYRLRRKDGGYIWVAEQGRITDAFGAPCRQSVLIDVTDVMTIRNQMRLLSKYMTDSILFLRRREGGLTFEVAVHGLGASLGEDAAAFTEEINSGGFFRRIGFSRAGKTLGETFMDFAGSLEGRDTEFSVKMAEGEPVRIIASSYRVADERSPDERSTAEYIVFLHKIGK